MDIDLFFATIYSSLQLFLMECEFQRNDNILTTKTMTHTLMTSNEIF